MKIQKVKLKRINQRMMIRQRDNAAMKAFHHMGLIKLYHRYKVTTNRGTGNRKRSDQPDCQLSTDHDLSLTRSYLRVPDAAASTRVKIPDELKESVEITVEAVTATIL